MDLEIMNKEGYVSDKLEDSYEDAEEVIENVDKVEEILQKLEAKFRVLPVVGGVLSYVPAMVSLVRSFIKKEYTEIPLGSIVAILGSLIFFLNPLDIIPDVIPVVGYVDDALVVAGAISLTQSDLLDYQNWRKKLGMEVIDMPNCDDPIKGFGVLYGIIKAYYKGKKVK